MAEFSSLEVSFGVNGDKIGFKDYKVSQIPMVPIYISQLRLPYKISYAVA